MEKRRRKKTLHILRESIFNDVNEDDNPGIFKIR